LKTEGKQLKTEGSILQQRDSKKKAKEK
jgi:hypothetical protein